MTPEQIALAVINDGGTYKERKHLIKLWAETPSTTLTNKGMAECRRGMRQLCWVEQLKPIYDGARLSMVDLDLAAEQVESYMANHYAESNNGKDWQ